MSAQTMTSLLPAGLAVRVFIAFAAGYFMSYGLRTVNVIIAPDLIDEFGLTHTQLGSLSSAYFLSFAALQLPLGIWLDRYGSRRTDAALLTVAAAGCAVFALAGSSAMLWVGRALIGVGVSGALMSSLRAFRFWYAAERQQQLAVWMLVAGALGSLVSTLPAQLALPLVGWRGLFWGACVLLCLCALSVYTVVPKEPAASNGDDSRWSGYREVFAEPYFWRFAVVSLTMQSTFIALQTLWIGPWFRQVLGIDAATAAQALFIVNLVLMCGFLGLGWAVPGLARRGVGTLQLVGGAALVMIVLQIAIAFASGPAAWLLWLPLALASTCQTLAQTHVSLSFPERLTGRAFTAYNLLVFIGMFGAQWLFGALVDLFGGQQGHAAGAAGFRPALLTCIAVQMVACCVLLGWRVQPPQPVPLDRSGELPTIERP
ncbi:MAG: MFS transporter [Burkholderiaceae bacterium]